MLKRKISQPYNNNNNNNTYDIVYQNLKNCDSIKKKDNSIYFNSIISHETINKLIEFIEIIITNKNASVDLFDAVKSVGSSTFTEGKDLLRNPQFVRLQTLRSLAQAASTSRLGINIDIDQAITRTTGAVRNPNLELLFNGPSLRI